MQPCKNHKMKSLTDRIKMYMLVVVMGLSPLQNVTASVSKCLMMTDDMHHQMLMSDSASDKSNMAITMMHDMTSTVKPDENMKQSDMQHDCCNEKGCSSVHCTGAVSALINSNQSVNLISQIKNSYQIPRISKLQFYPASLYRPPKI